MRVSEDELVDDFKNSNERFVLNQKISEMIGHQNVLPRSLWYCFVQSRTVSH